MSHLIKRKIKVNISNSDKKTVFNFIWASLVHICVYNMIHYSTIPVYIMEDVWSIVEFEDGMEMIPTSWIIEDKSAARWPNITSHLKFMKAVKNRISSENEWSLFKIKKILATSSKLLTKYKVKIL